MNMFIAMYIGYYYPLESRLKNRIELFNEIFIMIVSGHMMFFTEYIPEIEMQTYMGWYMISSIVANGVVNILIVMWFGGKSIVLVVIKYYRRAKHKL